MAVDTFVKPNGNNFWKSNYVHPSTSEESNNIGNEGCQYLSQTKW